MPSRGAGMAFQLKLQARG